MSNLTCVKRRNALPDWHQHQRGGRRPLAGSSTCPAPFSARVSPIQQPWGPQRGNISIKKELHSGATDSNFTLFYPPRALCAA